MQIIGQEKLFNIIDGYLSTNSLPQVVLLVGPRGSGKHSIITYIAEHLDRNIVDLSNNVSEEILSDIYLSVTKNIYLLDFSVISTKNQNSLLKFMEEPPEHCIIIGICEQKVQVIPTIQNRCQIWTLSLYSREQLNLFTEDEYLLDICSTPGQIKEFESLKDIDIEKYKQLAKNILTKIYNANIANILTISNNLSFKNDEQGNLSIDLFIRILKYTVVKDLVDSNLYIQYNIIEQLYNDSLISHINKKYLFENFLLRLKYLKNEY